MNILFLVNFYSAILKFLINPNYNVGLQLKTSFCLLLLVCSSNCVAMEPNITLCKDNARCYFVESELSTCQAVGHKLYGMCVPIPSDGKVCSKLFSAYYGCMLDLGNTSALVKGYLNLPPLSPCKFVASKLILYDLCSNASLDKNND